jgi:hypothetical protein
LQEVRPLREVLRLESEQFENAVVQVFFVHFDVPSSLVVSVFRGKYRDDCAQVL